MKKVPTLFERDWTGDRSRVVDQINPACIWVVRGEGVATRKIDGTCCLVRDGRLYKRREHAISDFHRGKIPVDFDKIEQDDVTGKSVGWMPIGDGPEDRWHQEAWSAVIGLADGTYELVGPKIQGNPERIESHVLIRHGDGQAGLIADAPRTFDGIRNWLAGQAIEGIVWHHPDGRMAKIKLRDFGLKRSATP